MGGKCRSGKGRENQFDACEKEADRWMVTQGTGYLERGDEDIA